MTKNGVKGLRSLIRRGLSRGALAIVLGALLLMLLSHANAQGPRLHVTGELKRWHKITVTLDGPATSVLANPNPFLDLRMDVTFEHAPSGQTFKVPGYFDADGNSANTSAKAGNKWRAILRPNQVGQWNYQISFRSGSNVSVSDVPNAGAAVKPFDGLKGSFTVAETDKVGTDFRAQGMLSYVGKSHLQFEGSKAFFLKVGADSPENLLAYADFDDTPNYTWQGVASAPRGGFRHDFAPHVRDWKPGDPTWKNGKGKGLIGAMNYLASKGLNSQSFLVYNTHGDDRNVSPYLNDEDRTRISVSKVSQWEIVFDHMEKLGLYMEMKLMEMENDWDHDGGELGSERKLYYRELIARFGHHLALNWNVGEENTNTRLQQLAFADYIQANDPYRHLIVIHTIPQSWDRIFVPLMQRGSAYRGASLQAYYSDVFDVTRYLRMASEMAGNAWVITIDESRQESSNVPDSNVAGAWLKGVLNDAGDPQHDDSRTGSLWANIMAGGAGMNSYLGFRPAPGTPGSDSADQTGRRLFIPDLMLENFRDYDQWWSQMRVAHAFFADNGVPFQNMRNRNELLSNGWTLGWALADATTIVGYFPNGVTTRDISHLIPNAPKDGASSDRRPNGSGPLPRPGMAATSPKIDLHSYQGRYEVRWYDPRMGGSLQPGSVTTLTAGGEAAVELGQPPGDPKRDWVVLIRPIRQ